MSFLPRPLQGLIFTVIAVALAGCSTQVAQTTTALVLAVTPGAVRLTPGGGGESLSIQASETVGGSGQASSPASVAVTISGMPAGMTATPATLVLTPGAAQSVSLSAATSTAPGAVNITFTGTAGSVKATSTIPVIVGSAIQPLPPDFSLSVTPSTATVTAGSSAGAVLSIQATALNGFKGNINVALTDPVQGIAFSPATLSVTPGTPQTVTVTAAATAAVGSSTMTVAATYGVLAHSATVALTVASVANSTINAKLGKPDRVLIGLGAGNSISDMNAQGIKPDVIDTYLPGVGSGSWINYNSPSGAYVTDTAQAAAAIGAIPMYTLYGMAQNGDGNLSGLSNSSFMDSYWSQARLMFQKLGAYGKPTMVNLEPDFWGYVEAQAPNNDPAQLVAVVNDQPECAGLGNTATGVAQCLLQLGHTYAPLTLIGYPASFFGEDPPTLADFMSKIGAQNADFIVAQTSDRDAGCPEVSSPPPECSGRGSGPFYWDESNISSPNFTESLTMWSAYRGDLPNNLPIIWWQTPMGVPSSTPGGTNQHYRDDHVDYMLKNAGQYANIGSFGIVFSSGASSQTVITTDGGQFANLFAAYLTSGGAPIP